MPDRRPEDIAADLRVRIAGAALEAQARSAEDLLSRSTALAPLEEGTLRGSGHVYYEVNGTSHGDYPAARQAVETAARAGVLRSFAAVVAFNTPYAARQHEEVGWNHPIAGQAKYLEEPFKQRVSTYDTVIAARVRQEVGDAHV